MLLSTAKWELMLLFIFTGSRVDVIQPEEFHNQTLLIRLLSVCTSELT